MTDKVFKVSPGDPISAETMNRVIDACNPEVGDGRAMPARSKMIPASFLNSGRDTIRAGTACLASWRDENADADTARRRFLRDGFCLQRVERYEVLYHRLSQSEAYSPYRRYIPVTLLKTAAPGKIVPCYLSGVFAATVRTNSAEKQITEAYWNPDRHPFFFSWGERFEREDSADYVFDVLAASAVKEAEASSQLRYDRFCILRAKTPPPAVGIDAVSSVDENGTVTGVSGRTYPEGSYETADGTVERNDRFYIVNGVPVSPIGLQRVLRDFRNKFNTLSIFAYWVRDVVASEYTYPGREPFPNWASHNPWGDDGDSGGESEAGDQSGGD